MDTNSAARRLGEEGVSSIQFILTSALALFLFVALANLVVIQYGRGAVRSALEQGARAGSVGGVAACESTVEAVVSGLLGGRMSDDLAIACGGGGTGLIASATGTFESWTPLMPDFTFSLSSRAVVEP